MLGGSVFDLLCREEGDLAGVALARGDVGLADAFHGRPRRHTEGTWHAHLRRMADGRLEVRRPVR